MQELFYGKSRFFYRGPTVLVAKREKNDYNI